ncbi:MAG: chorismate synthase [Lachnospiraceae bacterium]|nr:chorismate synthase [Lachnospiraceae bacterium]
MAGSTFGNHFRVTTFGESHGVALGCIVDGCPAGLPICEEDIQGYLDRRKPGTSAMTTQRAEADKVKILSGVFEGKTTGTPIAMMIENTSQHSGDYGNIAVSYRPGHADYGFDAKYGFRDYRGGGRSSGRETAARVAAGAIACKILQEMGIEVTAYTHSIGDVVVPADGLDYAYALTSPVCMPDAGASEKAYALVQKCRDEKDSIGGSVRCIVTGVPAGVGEPVFDKLDAKLSQALFSIGAVKAVEIGDGINVSKAKGSENNDAFCMKDGKVSVETNHAGGILGGISTGAPIEMMAYFKPTPSIYQPQKTVSKEHEEMVLEIVGRHDPVVVPRAVVVVECMAALTVLDEMLAGLGAKMENLKKIYG